MRVLLVVAYDGTEYCGWQVQDGQRTVEGVLNRAITELTGEETNVIGASRTDSGVHAMGNLAVFDTDSRIPAEKFAPAINRGLPEDVRIRYSTEVPADFHPRHCESVKTYEYRVYNSKTENPLVRRYTYFVRHGISLERMRSAAEFLIGEHDFKSFCSVDTQAKSTVRTVYSIDIEKTEDIITFRIRGNGFLYNMIRIIVGTLLLVGQGLREPEEVKTMLNACDRTKAGPTAPPQGLMLKSIEIDGIC